MLLGRIACRAALQRATAPRNYGSAVALPAEAEHVTYADPPNLRVVTLNRPEALNALTLPMLQRLTCLMRQWEKNSTVGAVVLTTDSKAFCAGGDVAQVARDGLSAGKGCAEQMDFFAEEYALNLLLATSTKPTVALLDGIVMGGGAGISTHGAFRVATEKSLFAMPETAIGLFPDVGMTHVLASLAPGRALGLYLGLTGARIGAGDLVRLLFS